MSAARWFLAALPVALLLVCYWDAWLKASGRETITAATKDVSARWPLLILAAGVVLGGLAVHFWPF